MISSVSTEIADLYDVVWLLFDDSVGDISAMLMTDVLVTSRLTVLNLDDIRQ